MTKLGRALALLFLVTGLGLIVTFVARADGMGANATFPAPKVQSCALNGAALAVCTMTVPAGCTPICTYQSSSLPHIVSAAVVSTTLTVVSATTLDTGNAACLCL